MDKQKKYCCLSFEWTLKNDKAIITDFMDNKQYYYMLCLHSPYEGLKDATQLKREEAISYSGKCRIDKLILYFCPFCGATLLGKPEIHLD
jgi:hypothetical protein